QDTPYLTKLNVIGLSRLKDFKNALDHSTTSSGGGGLGGGNKQSKHLHHHRDDTILTSTTNSSFNIQQASPVGSLSWIVHTQPIQNTYNNPQQQILLHH
ncbi:unnamed protein product, partial [Rotaria sp. Silwood2]